MLSFATNSQTCGLRGIEVAQIETKYRCRTDWSYETLLYIGMAPSRTYAIIAYIPLASANLLLPGHVGNHCRQDARNPRDYITSARERVF